MNKMDNLFYNLAKMFYIKLKIENNILSLYKYIFY